MKLFCLLVSILVSYFLFVPNASASVRHVPSGYSYIQNAVNASQDGDTILVANGLYREQVIIGQVRLILAGEFFFSHDTTDRDSTIITIPDSVRYASGDQKSVLIVRCSPNIKIIGLTLRDGVGTGYETVADFYGIWGGNLFADSSVISLESCRIVHGAADAGGGMAFHEGKLKITSCVFDSNNGLRTGGWSGGALYVTSDSLSIVRSRFFRNYHIEMAGVMQATSHIYGEIDSNTFVENSSELDCGTFLAFEISKFRHNQILRNRSRQHAGFIVAANDNHYLNIVFTDNIVQDNMKFDTTITYSNETGGGFYLYNTCTGLITDNIFDGNTNQGFGSSGITIESATFEVYRNRFTNNIGGHVSSAIHIIQPAQVSIDSNIFANNTRGPAINNEMATVHTHFNDFYGNSSTLHRGGNAQAVWFADSNWWGDASGPTVASNPNGHGDSLDSGIPYTPWLTSPVFPTAVREHNNEIANTFQLLQVYPNPFNNTTTIRYTLPRRTSVKVMLCDLTGREVDTLFRGILNAGTHSTSFDGSRFASGTYFVRLFADNRIQTKKIVLLK